MCDKTTKETPEMLWSVDCCVFGTSGFVSSVSLYLFAVESQLYLFYLVIFMYFCQLCSFLYFVLLASDIMNVTRLHKAD